MIFSKNRYPLFGIMLWSRRARSARGRRRESRAEPRGKLSFQLFGLGAQNRLAEAAELAGPRRFDVGVDGRAAAHFAEPGQRRRGEPPDDAEWGAFDLGFDFARLIGAHHLHRDFEGK